MSAFNTMRKPKDPQRQKKSMCLGKEVIQDIGREGKTERQDLSPSDFLVTYNSGIDWEMQGQRKPVPH